MRELVGPHAGRVPRAALLRVPRQGSPRAAPSAGDEAGRMDPSSAKSRGALDDGAVGFVSSSDAAQCPPTARGIAEEAPAARSAARRRERAVAPLVAAEGWFGGGERRGGAREARRERDGFGHHRPARDRAARRGGVERADGGARGGVRGVARDGLGRDALRRVEQGGLVAVLEPVALRKRGLGRGRGVRRASVTSVGDGRGDATGATRRGSCARRLRRTHHDFIVRVPIERHRGGARMRGARSRARLCSREEGRGDFTTGHNGSVAHC